MIGRGAYGRPWFPGHVAAYSAGNAIVGILFHVFVTPLRPPTTSESREKLQIRPRGTCFDQTVNLVGLSRMLSLPRRQEVHLTTTRA